MERVERALSQALASEVPLLATASEYIVQAGGKRLRPRVVLLSFRALAQGDIGPAVPLAAAVELLHTASLIHDDINDRGLLRRGSRTVSEIHGDGLALLVGDFVFVKVLNLIADLEPWALPVLSQACLDLVEGETRQMVAAQDSGLDEETYLSIVEQKTAALFGACGKLGALAAGAAAPQVAAMQSYGHNLGMAFQIRDDALDLAGDPDEMGKPVARDLREGKVTLAVLAAMRERPELAEAFEAGDYGRVQMLVREAGGLDYATETARHYAQAARRALTDIPESATRQALEDLAQLAWQRER